MDEATRLQNWLAKGASKKPLDELVERFDEVENFDALLQQQAQMRLVREFIHSQPCSCRTFPDGAKQVKCPSRNCRGRR